MTTAPILINTEPEKGTYLPVHTSDRAVYNRCQRRWYFTSPMHLNLTPSRSVSGIAMPLEFGTLIHTALEQYYNPGLKRDPVETFRTEWYKHFENLQAEIQGLEFMEWWPEWEAHRELGIGMLEYYKGFAEENDNFRVVNVEHDFYVPMGFSHPVLQLPVYYKGRMDAVIQDLDTERYFVLDHKAQPCTERVLTPTGWKQMGDIKPNDLVIGSNGKPTKVVNIFPQGKLDSYEVTFSDGTSTECSLDHLWTVFSSNKAYQTLQVKTLEWIRNFAPTIRLQIPILSMPVEFAARPITLDPYVLGCLLGDGSLSQSTISLSCVESELIETVAELLPDDVMIYKYKSNNHSWGFKSKSGVFGNTVLDAIKRYDLWVKSASKFVPEDYLYNTSDIRIAMLRGLMDTDGNCYNGYATFSNTSIELCEDVMFLVRSLGGIASMRERTGTTQQAWIIHVRMPVNPFAMSRKADAWENIDRQRRLVKTIVTIEPVGEKEMQCIQVEAEDGLYVTEDFIITHNTTGRTDDAFWDKLVTDEQCTSYAWAAELEAQHYDLEYKEIAGVYYNVLPKKFPRVPTVTYNGKGLSLDRQKECTTPEMFEASVVFNDLHEWFESNEKAQLYYQFLQSDENQFVYRKDVRRNRHQIENAGKRITRNVLKMINETDFDPQFTGEWFCVRCPFRGPCLMLEDGSDPTITIENNYELNNERDPGLDQRYNYIVS